ncbi:MAG: MotA/TolQ/ExbB proton channel family protein [Chitinispirillaceae bacterium]
MEAIRAYLDQGGVFMYPIIAGALWGLALVFERILFYMQTTALISRQTASFSRELQVNGIEGVQKWIASQRGLLPQVLDAAVSNRTLPAHRMEEKMEAVLLKELPSYSKFLNFIAVLASLMPMLGLLGTVTGMIATFEVIALQGTGDAQAMAGGIAEALITTQAGLVASVPIILGHTFVSNRLKKITDKVKESCHQIIDYMKDQNG